MTALGKQNRDEGALRVGVVGACATGKSTLVSDLQRRGFEARHIAQEHSYVPDMWRKIGRPDVLIYLDATYEAIMERRPKSGLREIDLKEQLSRLRHARQHCDYYLDTTGLHPTEVRNQILSFLNSLS
jgi:deoxyadenosine/deoxycytidine kinase